MNGKEEILDNVLDEPTDTGHVSKMCLTTPVPVSSFGLQPTDDAHALQGDTFRSQMQVDSRLNGSLLNIVLRDDGAEQDEVADEIIFVVRGYVVNKNLPPLGAELKLVVPAAGEYSMLTFQYLDVPLFQRHNPSRSQDLVPKSFRSHCAISFCFTVFCTITFLLGSCSN